MKGRLAGLHSRTGRRSRSAIALAFFVAAVLPAALAIAAASPAVTTGDVSGVSNSSATLHGAVDPNGSKTTYSFQWGLTRAYGASSAGKSAGSGSGSVSVQTKAGSLLPGTTYHYRLVASSKAGATNGNDRTFTTTGHPPPAAATGAIARIGRRSATLTGVVYPHGTATSYYFDYGTTTGYGSRTFTGVVNKGKPALVSQQIGGLSPGTVFHYRLVALHGGTVAGFGADRTFVTFPVHRSRAHLRARVSPRHDGSSPFRFLTHGTLAGVSPAIASSACPGTVAVSFSWHGKRVARHLIPVASNCTFKGRTPLRRLPGALRNRGGRIDVRIRFIGNGYLRPSTAKGVHVSIR